MRPGWGAHGAHMGRTCPHGAHMQPRCTQGAHVRPAGRICARGGAHMQSIRKFSGFGEDWLPETYSDWYSLISSYFFRRRKPFAALCRRSLRKISRLRTRTKISVASGLVQSCIANPVIPSHLVSVFTLYHYCSSSVRLADRTFFPEISRKKQNF